MVLYKAIAYCSRNIADVCPNGAQTACSVVHELSRPWQTPNLKPLNASPVRHSMTLKEEAL